MGELSNGPNLLTRYLLGDLSPTQQDSLEEKFFTENDLFIELLDARDQLISNYLGDRLSAADRELFERHFLTSPDCRSEVELAHFFRAKLTNQTLTEPVAPDNHAGDWWRSWLITLRANLASAGAATAVLVLVAIAGVWLASQTYLEQATNRGTPDDIAPVRLTIFTLELSPGRLRSTSDVPKAVKSAQTRAIALKLAAGATAFSHYRARLQRVEEEAVEVLVSNTLTWEQTNIRDRVIIWEIPTNKLSSGDYQIKLEGVTADNSSESIGTYYFRLVEE
jgi:anti-sigma factor RsiW